MRSMVGRFAVGSLMLLSSMIAVATPAHAAAPPAGDVVSVDDDGEYADRGGNALDISHDGRYVLLSSNATNLSFESQRSRLYVRDRQEGTLTLVSTSANNPDMALGDGRLSGNGRHLFFVTGARTVNPSDTDSRSYLFAKDLVTGAVVNVERTYIGTPTYIGSNAGSQFHHASADGSKVVFGYQVSGNNNFANAVMLVDRTAAPGTPALTRVADNARPLGLSSDGNTVYYRRVESEFNQPLVYSIYRYDVPSRTTTLVFDHLASPNAFTIEVSATGRYLGFIADSAMLYPQTPGYCEYFMTAFGVCRNLFRYDTVTATLERADVNADGTTPDRYTLPGSFQMSDDGNVFVWTTESIMRSNSTYFHGTGLYSKRLDTGAVHLVNVDANGVPATWRLQSGSALTADGSHVAMTSAAETFGAPYYCAVSYDERAYPNTRPCNNAYVVATDPAAIADTTPPQQVGITFLAPNALLGRNMPFRIDATDTGAGVAHGEFYLGDTDPGLGKGSLVSFGAVPDPDTSHFRYDLVAAASNLDTAGTVTIHYRVHDSFGNWSPTFEARFEVVDPSTDLTPPSLGAPHWTANPKQLDEASTLTVPADDDLTGVDTGEYYVGAADPGAGNGTGMSWNGATLSAEFDTGLAGVYDVHVRARDRAGNWSATVATTLVVGLPAPTGLSAATPTNNAPVLTWNTVPGAATYQVWREDILTGDSVLVSPAALDATNFTDGYIPGVYQYAVAAVDLAGNSSTLSAPVQVAVTNLSSPANHSRNATAQGQSRVVPVHGTDQLPGLATGSNTKADFDFSLGYRGDGTLDTRRALTFTYNIGDDAFHLASTRIDWLVVSGADNSVATFQGVADAVLNGTATAGLPFTVTAVDGDAAGNGTPHRLRLTVYTDASRATVLYRVDAGLAKGKIKIN